MEGIDVAEQPLPFGEQVFSVVDIILYLPGYDPGKFDLRVPVPQEIPLLIGLDGFRAYVNGKFIIPMTFDFFLVFFSMYLHHRHHFLNILIVLSNILIVCRDSSHYNYKLDKTDMQGKHKNG